MNLNIDVVKIGLDRASTSVGVALLCVLVSATGAIGNPNGSEPSKGLGAHGTIEGAKELAASMYQLYNEEEPIVAEMFQIMNEPDRFRGEKVERSAGRVWKALRDAEHLKLMGETAGFDLSVKFQKLHRVIHDFALRYRSSPQCEKLRQRSFKSLERDRKRMAKFLTQANAALENEKFEIFEKQMEVKGIELHEGVVFFSIPERNKYLHPFLDVIANGDGIIRTMRVKQYALRASEVSQQQVAAAMEFDPEASRVCEEIGRSGTAVLDGGKSGAAPEAFAHLVKRWGNASAAMTRADAVQWAFSGKRDSQMQTNVKQINDQAIKSLALLIENAGKATPEADLAETYIELLKEVGFAQRRMGMRDESLAKACAPAFEKFLASDPSMSSQVDAYTRATAQPLAWRRSFASQRIKFLSGQWTPTDQMISSSSKVASPQRPSFAGQGSTQDSVIAPDRLRGPAAWMVSDASSRLIGESVSQKQLLRISPASTICVVPLRNHHYVYTAIAPLLESSKSAASEIKDLQAALLIDDAYGPLSLEAADAISATEMNDCDAVGGVIKQVHLESMITRLAALPDAASVLTPLGEIPQIDSETSPLIKTCWRIDIDPTWIQNRYFVAKIGKDEG